MREFPNFLRWTLLPALALTSALCLVLMFSVACGDDDDDDVADDDTADDDTDDDDTSDDDTSDDDTTDDDTGDDDTVECTTHEECLLASGKLCEAGACVDPWRYNFDLNEIDDCADDPHATSMSLAEKAAHFDDVAARIHIHPDHKRMEHVLLKEGKTEATATWEDVEIFYTGENSGLWTGLYIASQAFRYAAEPSQAALDNLKIMIEGMEIGMDITGVPGIFTREYKTPGVPGQTCPTNPASYTPDVEKDDNKWVKVDDDGYVVIYDGDEWITTTHNVGAKFAGYCWLDNVSQDEYAGHMLALGAIYKLVDDPDVKGRAAALLEKVGRHLMEHNMGLYDWDDRLTEHGRFWPFSFADWPGFNAAHALGFMKMAVEASGDEDLETYYQDCLLQKSGPNDCIDRPVAPTTSFAEYLPITGLYFGHDACMSNWNNFAMLFLAVFDLIFYEHDNLDVRQIAQDVLENEMFFHDDNYREMPKQHNAAWDLVYASMKDVTNATGQDYAAINDAICGLRQFPESKAQQARDVGEDDYPTDFECESRFDGEYLTFDPVPVYDRCIGTFTWWSNPYEHQTCAANARMLRQPADYLLPYWMARYFGYVDETM
ncbi:MAG: hypothetical protein H6685_03235 [Deltaproteobacteria bacterium]|nr:hypothetical protein [Deltaproteobacteria bacterium]